MIDEENFLPKSRASSEFASGFPRLLCTSRASIERSFTTHRWKSPSNPRDPSQQTMTANLASQVILTGSHFRDRGLCCSIVQVDPLQCAHCTARCMLPWLSLYRDVKENFEGLGHGLSGIGINGYSCCFRISDRGQMRRSMHARRIQEDIALVALSLSTQTFHFRFEIMIPRCIRAVYIAWCSSFFAVGEAINQ